MQLIDTRVGNAIDGTVTVEFKGEGGELVSVRMASVEGNIDEDSAIRRAKEIMVQLTAFGGDQSVTSNGAVDETTGPGE